MSRIGSQVVWDPVFTRTLLEIKAQFLVMLSILDSIFIPKEGNDKKVRMGSIDHRFFMASFISAMVESF